MGGVNLTGAARLRALVVTTISIILAPVKSSDILVPAYLGYPGKWLLNECRSAREVSVPEWPDSAADDGI